MGSCAVKLLYLRMLTPRKYSTLLQSPLAVSTLRIAADQPFHLIDEFRVDVPVRRFLPGHMFGANRVADIHMLDFRPAIDQHCARMGLQEFVSGYGGKMLHDTSVNHEIPIL